VLRLPAKADEQFVVVRLASEDRSAGPLALLVTIDSGAAGGVTRTESGGSLSAASTGNRRLKAGTPEHARIAAGASAAVEQWEFSGTKGERYALLVVPSQRAGLVLQVTVYEASTEDVIARHERISDRVELPLLLPAAGRYVVELRALSVGTPDAEGQALYSVELLRRPR
jgi:hypothetical protein